MCIRDSITVYQFLDPLDYKNYLNNIDIYLLHYSPDYYKYRSSGHLIELMAMNKVIIGTRDTVIEDVHNEYRRCFLYDYSNIQSLLASTIDAHKSVVKNHAKNDQKYIKSSKKAIEPWTLDYFKSTI